MRCRRPDNSQCDRRLAPVSAAPLSTSPLLSPPRLASLHLAPPRPAPPRPPQNDLVFLRVRSRKHEIMIAPDREYLLVVIQNPAAGEDAAAGGAGSL